MVTSLPDISGCGLTSDPQSLDWRRHSIHSCLTSVNTTGNIQCKPLLNTHTLSLSLLLCSDFPVMVVATAPKRDALPAQVAMEMLHVIEMAPPTESQRLEMLRGLAGGYLMSPTISWSQLATQTAVSTLNPSLTVYYCQLTPLSLYIAAS